MRKIDRERDRNREKVGEGGIESIDIIEREIKEKKKDYCIKVKVRK